MKKNIFLLLLAIFSYGVSQAQCDTKKISKACKPQIKPYHYDGFAYTDLTFDDKPRTAEVEFSCFAGEKYRLVFCHSDFKEKVGIKVYDKKKTNQNRKVVYDSEEKGESNVYSFEPPKPGNYYIVYTIPTAIDNRPKTGCMVLLIGYQ